MNIPDSLYYFGEEQYALPILKEGRISFAVAETYVGEHLTDAQRDNEMQRKFTPQNAAVAVGGQNPADAAMLTNVTAVSLTLGIRVKYYFKSFACDYDEGLFKKFPGGVCIKISDTRAFSDRFLSAFCYQFPGWGGLSGRVSYTDLKALPKGYGQIDLMFLKDADEYSDQGEYRFVLLPPEGEAIKGRRELLLGSLEDIGEVIRKG